MSILDSLTRSIKNVFVGSHRGEDFIIENLEKLEEKKEMPEPENKNDMGVDPHEWFDNPLDTMPVATDTPSWEDTAPSEYEPPDDDWFSTPKNEKEEEITMHEKMYRMATARYNPFSLGGSENCDSDISCNIGGSENLNRKDK